MTRHDDALYLGQMLDVARNLLQITAGKLFDDLSSDKTLEYAVAHALSLIGEAARKVSPSTRQAIESIPWTDIAGLRNRIAHDDFNINLERVWDTIQRDIQPLVSVLQAALPTEPPD